LTNDEYSLGDTVIGKSGWVPRGGELVLHKNVNFES
jgi:hypothetical protein